MTLLVRFSSTYHLSDDKYWDFLEGLRQPLLSVYRNIRNSGYIYLTFLMWPDVVRLQRFRFQTQIVDYIEARQTSGYFQIRHPLSRIRTAQTLLW